MPPPPSAAPTQLTDQSGIEWVFGVAGVQARLDVDRTGVVSAAELLKLDLALNYGSEYVYAKLGNRYALAEIQESWLAYWWASVVAAHKFAFFTLGAVPAALQAEFEATDGLLTQIHLGQWRPATLKSLSGAGVALDNLRLDPRMRDRQQRRVRVISDGSRQEAQPVNEDIPSRYRWDPQQ